jgi:hypothetical protein
LDAIKYLSGVNIFDNDNTFIEKQGSIWLH